jgi:hypothetical protein
LPKNPGKTRVFDAFALTNQGKLYKTPGVTGAGNTELAIVNSGTFQLQNGGTLNIRGTDGSNYAFNQSAGTCELSNGSSLSVTGGGNGFHMSGGNLWIDGATGATILGAVTIEGGVISLDHDNPNATGALQITGTLTLKGTAEYDAKIMCAGTLSADQISAAGITLAGTAKLKAISIDIPPGGVPAGKTWTILKATGTGNTIAGDFGVFVLDFNDGSGKKYKAAENVGKTEYYLQS